MNDDDLRDRLLIGLELLHQQFQRREASGWLVLCYAEEFIGEVAFHDLIVGVYGPFASPEEALVQAGKHDATSDTGFKNIIVPLYPPVRWKGES